MKNIQMIFTAIALVFATATFGYSAELTTVNETVATPPNAPNTGTVTGVNSDGTIVIVDHETGAVLIFNPNGLSVDINIGDVLNYIVIQTPNGNYIVQKIRKGNGNR